MGLVGQTLIMLHQLEKELGVGAFQNSPLSLSLRIQKRRGTRLILLLSQFCLFGSFLA